MSVHLPVQLSSSYRPATPRPARPAPISIGAGRTGARLDALWQFLKLAPAQGREGGDLGYGLILIKVVAPRSSVMEMKPPDRSEVHGNAVAPVAWPIVVAEVRG